MSVRSSTGNRLWPCPAAVVALAVTAFVLYNTSPPSVANIVIYPYALILIFGPSIIYPWLRWREASTAQAVSASLCVPVLWVLKECYAFSAVFSFGETVLYAFNPLSFGLFTGAALEMAVCELLLRRAWGGRWQLVNPAGFVCAGILILAGAFAVIARGNDATIAFYAYIAVYRYLFGG